MQRAMDQTCSRKIVYWHRELPPIDAEPLGEHVVEATSHRVNADLLHRDEAWQRGYDDLMAHADDRLRQEVARLGGQYAHVFEESIDRRRDEVSGEAWLHGRFSYVLLARGSRS